MANSDLYFYLTGGAANSDPDASLGGVGSSTKLSATALNNLFDNIEPDEITSSDRVEYRAIDIRNDGTATARNVEFYFTDTPNSESIVAAWYDSTGTQTIADELTEPVGASGNWTTPTSASKMSLSNLAVGSSHRMWIRRTVSMSADNINDDTATLHVWFS